MDPESQTKSPFGPNRRRRFNVATVCSNIFFPWFIFGTLFSLVSFKLHYDNSSIVWTLVLCWLAVPLVAAILGFRASRREMDTLWYSFVVFASLIAIGLASLVGNLNFTHNMKPFYLIQSLQMYTNINVAQTRGGQMTDAGRIHFAPGTGLDTRRAMGFKGADTFCVAPIVTGSSKMGAYDFWAVGKNCCSSVSSDFRCGEYNNPRAMSGLRQMNDEERGFYRLAVQQAEAAYGIRSVHPLFFKWVEDPVADINNYQERGFWYFLFGLLGHFFFNFCCVVVTVVIGASGYVGGGSGKR